MKTAEAAPSQRCEALVPLFKGPTGAARLGRLLDGPDKGRLVLLRSVAPKDIVGLELTVGVVRTVTHPAIGKVVGLVRDSDSTYVASEHIDGITVHELLSTIRTDAVLDARIGTRILHDALVAADEIDVLLGWKLSPRCLFADTIWIAEYGATLLSEAGVADYVHRAAKRSAEFGDARDAGCRLDVRASLELLALLLTSDKLDPHHLTPAQIALPSPLRQLLSGAIELPHRRAVAEALAALPADLIGSESEVAAAVGARFGVTLEMRRLQSTPLEAIRDRRGDDDETACFAGPLPGLARGKAVETTSTRRAAEPAWPIVSGERRVVELDWNQPLPDDDADDDQELTTAFRPSRIPRLGLQRPPAEIERRSDELTQSSVLRTQRAAKGAPAKGVANAAPEVAKAHSSAVELPSPKREPEATPIPLVHTQHSVEHVEPPALQGRDSVTSKPSPAMTAKEAALFDLLEQERQRRAWRVLSVLLVLAVLVSGGLVLASVLG